MCYEPKLLLIKGMWNGFSDVAAFESLLLLGAAPIHIPSGDSGEGIASPGELWSAAPHLNSHVQLENPKSSICF